MISTFPNMIWVKQHQSYYNHSIITMRDQEHFLTSKPFMAALNFITLDPVS
jgi:hypothetical protein